ncbi:hypothetical protein Mmc1_1078 [Magnetococcus marinus MC-1]|uniref:Uncharacterized protein n=1 Tax=Magnetococcus marinus (strain ATCC BAA-1437 / JCM 17883 / MC-1) TaxID=156889 RepID=A0L6K3_MAGMM|nr:hypothetical protein Mmc1_1078 [Magnetococcus marinus MC-1]
MNTLQAPRTPFFSILCDCGLPRTEHTPCPQRDNHTEEALHPGHAKNSPSTALPPLVYAQSNDHLHKKQSDPTTIEIDPLRALTGAKLAPSRPKSYRPPIPLLIAAPPS